MVLYLDSSVLIKHYQQEDGSEPLERRLQTERENSRVVFTSVHTYAEVHAVIERRRTGAVTEHERGRRGP
ncbi:MAG: hypothetical protein DMG39_25935 [Acidobacteria bacterium]|nr:MAG: hypothetical protein DMG39_25935 [Acidobacteriota bacterium]